MSEKLPQILDSLKKLLLNPILLTVLFSLFIIYLLIYFFVILPENNLPKVEKTQRHWGHNNAKIIVEYYGDFECPACKFFWENTEKVLKEKYSDKIKFIFNHFPLTSIHAKADDAAEAAEAAGAQGKFFEYSSKLYEKQAESKSWNIETFVKYAREVGVPNIEDFKNDLETKKYRSLIREYIDEGKKRGITGTPTIFINNEKMQDFSLEALESKINELLNKHQNSK